MLKLLLLVAATKLVVAELQLFPEDGGLADGAYDENSLTALIFGSRVRRQADADDCGDSANDILDRQIPHFGPPGRGPPRGGPPRGGPPRGGPPRGGPPGGPPGEGPPEDSEGPGGQSNSTASGPVCPRPPPPLRNSTDGQSDPPPPPPGGHHGGPGGRGGHGGRGGPGGRGRPRGPPPQEVVVRAETDEFSQHPTLPKRDFVQCSSVRHHWRLMEVG
ncbi:Protein of unknown function [Gryllus bimaculatus]|nr:Protein of unknown function [Gryllus bimaculatus]